MPSLPDLPEELWEQIYLNADSSKDKSALRRCCSALYKSQLINRHVTSCCLRESAPGEAIKKLQAYPPHATLESLKIIAQDEKAKGEGLEGILEVLLLLSSSKSEVGARLHNVASLTIQGSFPEGNDSDMYIEEDIRPRGSLITAKCGELLPQLLPRLFGTDAGQHVGWVEFVDCNLCFGEFLSVFASNVQLRSLSIVNNSTVTDDPSELMRHVCQFEELHDLSISLRRDYEYFDPNELLLTDLYELQALQTLSFSNCFISDVDVLRYLPNLLSLSLHDVCLPKDEGGVRLISPSLQTLRIDKLTFAHHTISLADLPALTQLIFSSFDLADAPLGDERKLRCMLTQLATLPLHAIESLDPSAIGFAARKFPSFSFKCSYFGPLREKGHEHLTPILRGVLESPLAEVFCSLKVVFLDFDASQLGPGTMRVIYDLFSGAEQISCVLGCTDDEAVAAAISCNTQLRTLQLYDKKIPRMYATIVPALLEALRLGKSFELCLYVGNYAYGFESRNQQLDCITKEWEDLRRRAAGAGSDVCLSVKHGYPGY